MTKLLLNIISSGFVHRTEKKTRRNFRMNIKIGLPVEKILTYENHVSN